MIATLTLAATSSAAGAGSGTGTPDVGAGDFVLAAALAVLGLVGALWMERRVLGSAKPDPEPVHSSQHPRGRRHGRGLGPAHAPARPAPSPYRHERIGS